MLPLLWIRARIVGLLRVSLDMLLQILGSLKGLAAVVALVGLQGDVDADVTCYVIALHSGGPAVSPVAGEIQIVGRLATDVGFADMVLVVCQSRVRYSCQIPT